MTDRKSAGLRTIRRTQIQVLVILALFLIYLFAALLDAIFDLSMRIDFEFVKFSAVGSVICVGLLGIGAVAKRLVEKFA